MDGSQYLKKKRWGKKNFGRRDGGESCKMVDWWNQRQRYFGSSGCYQEASKNQI